ncbi:MAG: lytic transglycosylase domain-containing protein [Kiritimatiellae bacterium]|nr:lytic transglycosylase domain-containing protein [Kiritimatiellia bacterium]
MKKHLSRLLALSVFASLLSAASAQEADGWAAAVAEGAGAAFEALAPASVKKNWRMMTPDEMLSAVGTLSQALSSEDGTWESVLRLVPDAKNAAVALDALPLDEDVRAWIDARLSYFLAANELAREEAMARGRVRQAARVAAASPKPAGRPAAAPQPATGRPSAAITAAPETVAESRAAYEADVAVWRRKFTRDPPTRSAEKAVKRAQKIFREEGVREELAWLAFVESSGRADARSPVGAAGLFQFMPKTAESMGLALSPKDERLEADKCARAAAKYLARLRKRFGDWKLALAAYNYGEGNVSKKLGKARERSFEGIRGELPMETRLYVPKLDAILREKAGKKLADIP